MPPLNDEKNPLVSIVIPVYNGSDFVKEAIDSAFAQTYENIEIIVVNDGSADNGATREIALSYGDKIRYIEKENGGVSSALNRGIAEMKGAYFSWLSHDDMYTPEKIERQVDLLKTKDHCVTFCVGDTIDAASQMMKKGTLLPLLAVNEENPSSVALQQMFSTSSYGGCNFLIPAAAFKECGLFDESLRYVQDMLMWIRLFVHGYRLVYGDHHGVLSRVHEGQLTQRGQAMFESESTELCRIVLPDLLKISSPGDNVLYYFAKYNAKYHNTEAVKMCVSAAKQKKLFSAVQLLKLRALRTYGAMRPGIRRVYYQLFRRMKTK